MSQISNDVITAIKRKRGERNISINKLAEESGVSRFSIYRLFDGGENKSVYPTTKERLVNWLANNS